MNSVKLKEKERNLLLSKQSYHKRKKSTRLESDPIWKTS